MRIPRLDTFRAMAALSVIYLHYYWFVVPSWMHFVPDGVQFFFVLSGFLITSGLLRNKAEPITIIGALRSFYIRRVFRIFPAYYGLFIIALVLAIPDFPRCWLWVSTFTMDFNSTFGIGDPVYAGHLWTLAVEEQFYLILPLIILIIPETLVSSLGGALIVIAIFYRWFVIPHDNRSILGNVDSLVIGTLLAMWSEKFGASKVERYLRYAVCFTFPSFLIVASVSHFPASFSLLIGGPLKALGSLFFAWLIIKAVKDGPKASSWGGRILPKIGEFSYSVYLLHLPMIYVVGHFLRITDPNILRVVAIALTLSGAWISHEFFEQPLIRLGRKLASRKRMSSALMPM